LVIRILYISGEDAPGDHAGAVHTWESARHLAARGNAVTLACNLRPDQPSCEVREGVRIVRSRMNLLGQKAPIRLLPHWHQLLTPKPDVILERYITLGGTGALLARYSGIPLVLEVNSPHVEEVIHRWHVPQPLRFPLFAWRDFQFKWSALAFSPLPSIVPPWFRDRSRKLLWGVDSKRFRPRLAQTDRAKELIERYGLKDRRVLLFVGSFLPWQGAKHLPAILAEVIKQEPRALLLAVGHGWEDGEVIGKMKGMGLEGNFRTTGRIPHADISYLCSVAEVGLAPFDVSVYNPLVEMGFFWVPSKMLEYLAAGLPVVSSDYPLLRELLGDGKRGALVPPGDDTAFAGAISGLLRNPEARTAMGREGRAYAEEVLAWDKHAATLEDYLREGLALGAWAKGK
jgi:glycosyltransferase involved in cell wall biosynthesis